MNCGPSGKLDRGILAAFYLPIKRLYIAHNPSRSPPVLPTTASTTALHPTPPPPSSLRGRGRGRARSKGRLFGCGIGDRLGLGLGRRAKTLGGPVLPRFASSAHYTPLASAPASPSLSASASLHPPSPYLAEFPADPTAVPLVDLGASWGTISSISHTSSSHSSSHTHAQLVDVSHAGDAEDYALVDVSVPPSPAAWARAHPPLKPTPTSSFPTSPAFTNDVKRSDETHLPSPPLSPTFPSPATARPGSAFVGLALGSTTLASSPSLASSKAELEFVASKDVEEEEPVAPSSPSKPESMVVAPEHAAPLLLPVATDRAHNDEFRPAADVDPADHDFRAVDEEPAQRSPVTTTDTTKPNAPALHIDLPAPPSFPVDAEQEEFGDEGEELGREQEEAGLPSAHAIDALLAGVRALHPAPPASSPAGRSPALVEGEEAEVEVAEVVDVEGEVEDGKVKEPEVDVADVADVTEVEVEAAPAPAPAPRLLFPRTRAATSSSSSYSQSDFGLDADDDCEEEWAGEVPPLPASLLHAHAREYGEGRDEEAHTALVAWVDGLPALAARAHVPAVEVEAAGVDEAEVEVDGGEVGEEVEQMDAGAVAEVVDGAEDVDADVDVEQAEAAAVEDAVESADGEVEDALPPSPSPTRGAIVMDADADGDAVDEQADSDVDAADVEQAEVEVEAPPASPSPIRGTAVMDALPSSLARGDAADEQADVDVDADADERADVDDPADLPLPSTTPVRARFDLGPADVDVEDPEELALPSMPMPTPPLLAVRAPILALDVDEDIEEQDLASPASSSPSSSLHLPSSPPPKSPSSSSSDLDDEEDIGASPRALALVLRPRATPAWSRRAAAAPALGLPSSTLHLNSAVRENLNGALRESLNSAVSSAVKEREWDLREWEAGWVPGAFPSSSAASIAAQDKDAQAKDNAHSATTDGTSQAVTKTKPELRPRRSPLDAALAMQLRPGLGLGADGAWLVRFLMSFFGWLGVLVAGNGNANGAGAGGRRRV